MKSEIERLREAVKKWALGFTELLSRKDCKSQAYIVQSTVDREIKTPIPKQWFQDVVALAASDGWRVIERDGLPDEKCLVAAYCADGRTRLLDFWPGMGFPSGVIAWMPIPDYRPDDKPADAEVGQPADVNTPTAEGREDENA